MQLLSFWDNINTVWAIPALMVIGSIYYFFKAIKKDKHYVLRSVALAILAILTIIAIENKISF